MAFDEIKARVGRGGAGFEIKLPRDKYREGETIQGEVHILGGRVIQKLDAIQIKLVREWNTEFYKTIAVTRDPGVHIGELAYRGEYVEEHVIEGDSGKDVLVDIELARDYTIQPGEKEAFPFSLSIPKVKKEGGAREVWKLEVRGDIPFAKDALAEKTIKIMREPGTEKR